MDRTATYRIELHLFDHSQTPDGTVKKALDILIHQGARLMSALDNLTETVTKNKDVTDSAVVLLQGLKAKLDEAIASGDPTKIQALSDSLGTETQALADAVAANTPAP